MAQLCTHHDGLTACQGSKRRHPATGHRIKCRSDALEALVSPSHSRAWGATMALRGRRGGTPAREDEPRHDERAEQQAPAPPGPVLPPPPPVDYGVFMQGLVQAMQTQAHTQAALQAQLEAQAITLCPRHQLPPNLKPSTSPAKNFLRVSPSTTLPDLQNLFLLDSMASSTVSDSVGGYGAAFLTAEDQTRFASVKAKLCGHKAVDLADLEKNGMGSLVEALQRLKWTKIATLSDIETSSDFKRNRSYNDFLKRA
ncbi:hypothetical protein Taro_005973 [Colocasia esculenta]|uniref:Uncharacterized protein n=1 Tax=Colocasia esculenta TaxID=4460 RepID=A0A843TVV2_COLES|nr:hypothetical protein [Colocasia esculenta]